MFKEANNDVLRYNSRSCWEMWGVGNCAVHVVTKGAGGVKGPIILFTSGANRETERAGGGVGVGSGCKPRQFLGL